ncbi:hypothetical protein FHR32_005313 [Streptosporangium album]|uniref:Uncharacterized protein n=1 Tax=Streptosporangium album TaxID=47479 RepID=A0A7W7WBF4_9ACTN|nr:hypothetical protein [Streptosporangium album]MBB4940936.1 hypothetical protein [Streptosporangium album]
MARELPGYVAVVQERAWRALADREAGRDQARRTRQAELGRLRDAGRISAYRFGQAWPMTWHDDEDEDGEDDRWIEPMRVAGAGVISGAAAVVTWINRREFDRWDFTGAPAAHAGGRRPGTAGAAARRLRTRRAWSFTSTAYRSSTVTGTTQTPASGGPACPRRSLRRPAPSFPEPAGSIHRRLS